MNLPKISVLIPTRNRLNLLRSAVESALIQDYPNIEIVISDNWSEDGTSEWLAAELDERIVTTRPYKSVGMMENWNHALHLSTGDYFLMLSDDDQLAPSGISLLVAEVITALSTGELPLAVIGRVEITDERGVHLAFTHSGPQREAAISTIVGFLKGNRSNYPCGNLLHTLVAKQLGGYNGARFGVAADGALWMSLALKAGFVLHTQLPVATYCMHVNNATLTTSIGDWVAASVSIRAMLVDNFCTNAKHRKTIVRAGKRHTARLLSSLAASKAIQSKSRIAIFLSLLFPYKDHIINPQGIWWFAFAFAKVLTYGRFFRR